MLTAERVLIVLQPSNHVDEKAPMKRHAQCLLACDAEVGLVISMAQAQCCIHHDGIEGVHGADIVQHVAVLQGHTHQDHQEVQAPHHLTKPACRI